MPQSFLFQLALDMPELKQALLVTQVAGTHVDRLEAGTPLLISAGLQGVRELRAAFPDTVIVADTKICDAGERIAKTAWEAGADVVTLVAAAADSATWDGVLRAKRALADQAGRTERAGRAGRAGRLMVDLIGTADPCLAAREAAERGADELVLHLPKRHSPADQTLFIGGLELAGQICHCVPIPLYIAGGLKPEDLCMLEGIGAAGIIVGQAVTGANDPLAAIQSFRNRPG